MSMYHNLHMSKTNTLSLDELQSIETLCDLAHTANTKHLQLADKSNNSLPRPLRLQNLTLPARVSACRVVLDMAEGTPYRKSLQKQGLTHLQFEVIRHKDHDFALVVEAAKRVRDALQAADAQSGLSRLITEDECGLNAKAVMFAAERLDPKRFGRAAEDGEGGRSGVKAVYNIVINAGSGGLSCDNLATKGSQEPVIDLNTND